MKPIKSNLVSLVLSIILFSFSSIAICAEELGIAKEATYNGRAVTYTFYLENHSSNNATMISFDDNLDAVFGAGNYQITSPLGLSSGPNTFTLNPSFNGSSNTNLIVSGTLTPGQTASFSLGIEITAITDQGLGLGVYSNQVMVTADINGSSVSDLSDSGSNPDPSGNANPKDAGEDDPTIIEILASPLVGLAKSVIISGTQLEFHLYLENLGNRDLQNLSIIDDLDNVFGTGNYSIILAPSLVDDPGTLTLNAGFNGSGQNNLITSGTLALMDTAEIQFTINVDIVTDQGLGLGVYLNQASITADTNLGLTTNDLSDQGVLIDSNNNGNANEAGENDPTIIVIGEEAVIGLAQDIIVSSNASDSSFTVNYYLENLGNTTLHDFSLIDEFNTTLGLGNYYIQSAPSFIDDPGSLDLNASFDGNFQQNLLTSGTLAAGDTAQIQLIVKVVNLTDQGFGLGSYQNQATIMAESPLGVLTFDYSDNGTNVDTNDNNKPNEVGENDPTSFTVLAYNAIGIAKQFISGGLSGAFPIVDLRYTVTNYGNQLINSITINDDLNSVYGAGNFTHTDDPALISGVNTFNFNAAFNGNTNTSMLNAGSSLAAGETVTFNIKHQVVNISDQGFGTGIFQNQVTLNALTPLAMPISDLSHEGNNPDPNANNNPNEAGENDPTVIDVTQIGEIGLAIDASVVSNLVTLNYYLENFGTLNVTELSILQNLDSVFGAGNYSISSAPTLISDPGTITLNPSFDGTSDNDLIDLNTSSLAVFSTAQIQLQVLVNTVSNVGLGLGNYSIQSNLQGLSAYGQLLSDLSDSGVDPDPNGNGNPKETGENDASLFSIIIDAPIGAALTAGVVNNIVTFDVYLENLGTSTLTSVNLNHSLDTAFGAGNYQIIASPTFLVDPGSLVLNGAYDGSENSNLLSNSSNLTMGSTAQIQFQVQVDIESDQGNGFGVYTSQTTATATQASGTQVSDLSDDGIDPDANGNSDPGEAGEEDPTPVLISVNPSIGLAYLAYLDGTQVTMDFTIENLGDATLTNIMMSNPLNPVFGSANYSIVSQPTRVTGASSLSLSPQYFGFNIFDRIIVGGYLRPGESETIRVVVNVTNVTDQGSGFGIYLNSVTVTSSAPDGSMFSDTSDEGTIPDTNTNGNAGDVGEDDATNIIIGDEARIGLATQVAVAGQQVTLDLFIENLGASSLSNLSLPVDLDSIFGAGNYTISSPPSFIDDPGTLVLNPVFNGSANTELFNLGSIAAMDTAQIRLVVDVTVIDDVGLGFGNYSFQTAISASAPFGSLAYDLSDDGIDPDPNGNSLANDAGESDPSLFGVGYTNTGLAKSVVLDPLDPSQTTFIVTLNLKNIGSTTYSNIQIIDDLDSVFGTGNYTVTSPPSFIGNGRDLETNPLFNGSTDTNIILFPNTASMPANSQVGISFSVQVNYAADLGSGVGVYSNQATVNIFNPLLTDLSDDGTIIDPNMNNDANEAGENDPSIFTLPLSSAPAFNISFLPSTIALNGTTTLTYTIDNSTSVHDVNTLSFVNNLATGIEIAPIPNLNSNCNGMAVALAGNTTVSLTNGTIGFSGSCQISVDLVATNSGMLVNTTEDLTSNLGNSGMASATLDVDVPAIITPPANINIEATGPLTPASLGVPIVVDDRDVGLVAVANNLGPYPLGLTTVTWSVTDSSGNLSTAQQTVTINDTTAPIITLNGAATINLNAGDSYVELGATATDLVDDDSTLTANISISGMVNTSVDGTYLIDYDVTDSNMNSAVTVTRTVIVTDNPPVITLPANISTEATATLTPVNIGSATALDDLDGVLTPVADNLGPYPVGTTMVTWSVTDSFMNLSTSQQMVTINDTTAPIITLNGAATINLIVGDTYNELGALASDLVDDDVALTTNISITGLVNTTTAGTYTIRYNVTDTAGNPALEITRTVNVLATIGGTITGLAAGNTLEIQNNATETLILTDNGAFTFLTPLALNVMYTVALQSQPTTPSQTCMISNNIGTVTAGNITTVQINCSINQYFVAGVVNDLAAGNSVTLEISPGPEQLQVNSNGAFTFMNPLSDLTNFLITVANQPTIPSQTCEVLNGDAQVNGNDYENVVVNCIVDSFFIGGTVTGLESGYSLILRNNGGDDLNLITNGSFVFATPVLDLQNYNVSLQLIPENGSRTCFISNGSGVVSSVDVDDVMITCIPIPDVIFLNGFEIVN